MNAEGRGNSYRIVTDSMIAWSSMFVAWTVINMQWHDTLRGGGYVPAELMNHSSVDFYKFVWEDSSEGLFTMLRIAECAYAFTSRVGGSDSHDPG
eukprot:6173643-Pleurochrysis_carterae.AAC.1